MPHRRTALIKSPPRKRLKSSEENTGYSIATQNDFASVSTMSTALPDSKFHFFSKLDKHLRVKIWLLAAPPPRTRFVEIYNYTAAVYNIGARVRYVPSLPAIFSATWESRQAVIAAQGGHVISLFTRPRRTEFYFNFQHDILFLSSRFASGIHASETYRLREIESLIPYRDLVRLRRIVITYSGEDDYTRIALSMRWLKRLETLYVAMMDWWSKKSVTRLLRKGFPTIDTTAMRIEKSLTDLDGEETEDDSDAERDEKEVAIKRHVRVVEVELRLEVGED